MCHHQTPHLQPKQHWSYNHYVSILPLKIRSEERYNAQLEKYKKYRFT